MGLFCCDRTCLWGGGAVHRGMAGSLGGQNPECRFSGRTAGGSAGRVTAAIVLAEPVSIADGEATAKGNINFPRFLTRRAAVVDRLFDGDASDVLRILQ